MPGFDITTMSPNDLFAADIVGNRNFSELADNLYPMWKGTRAAYDAIAVKQQKLYIVEDGNNVKLYFADKPVSGGSQSAVHAVLNVSAIAGRAVNAETT